MDEYENARIKLAWYYGIFHVNLSHDCDTEHQLCKAQTILLNEYEKHTLHINTPGLLCCPLNGVVHVCSGSSGFHPYVVPAENNSAQICSFSKCEVEVQLAADDWIGAALGDHEDDSHLTHYRDSSVVKLHKVHGLVLELKNKTEQKARERRARKQSYNTTATIPFASTVAKPPASNQKQIPSLDDIETVSSVKSRKPTSKKNIVVHQARQRLEQSISASASTTSSLDTFIQQQKSNQHQQMTLLESKVGRRFYKLVGAKFPLFSQDGNAQSSNGNDDFDVALARQRQSQYSEWHSNHFSAKYQQGYKNEQEYIPIPGAEEIEYAVVGDYFWETYLIKHVGQISGAENDFTPAQIAMEYKICSELFGASCAALFGKAELPSYLQPTVAVKKPEVTEAVAPTKSIFAVEQSLYSKYLIKWAHAEMQAMKMVAHTTIGYFESLMKKFDTKTISKGLRTMIALWWFLNRKTTAGVLDKSLALSVLDLQLAKNQSNVKQLSLALTYLYKQHPYQLESFLDVFGDELRTFLNVDPIVVSLFLGRFRDLGLGAS